MAEQPRAQLDIDAIGGVGEDVGAKSAEDRLEDRDGDEADQQHVQGRHAAMDQHLVHHHLEEQRRDQGEYLQEEGREQHLAQDVAVLVDRAHEPGDVELPAEIRQGRAPRDEDERPVPEREERILVQNLSRAAGASMHQHLVVVAAAENEKAAILCARQRRQRRGSETVVRAGRAPRLQVLMARKAHDIVGANLLRAGKLTAQRLCSHRQAVKAEQRREATEGPLTDISSLG